MGHSRPQRPHGTWPRQLEPVSVQELRIGESRGSRLELRLETFNTWNHTQFNAVDTNLGDTRFGQYTSAFDPRILQLGGKIYF